MVHSGERVQTHKVLLCLPLIAFVVLCRSNAFFILVVPIYLMAHELIRFCCGNKSGESGEGLVTRVCMRVGSMFTCVMYAVTIVLMVAVAAITLAFVVVWKPFEMYCLSRLDSDEAAPEWCFDTPVPSIYGYIQKKYWDVGFLGFLDRPWYLFATALFTNALVLYLILRLVQGHGVVNFLTGGILATN